MENYQPPFSITNSMLSLVASISEKLGRISVLHNLESRPHLRRNNRIRSIHSSLRIEANSLNLSQVRDVLDGHLVLGKPKEIQEVITGRDGAGDSLHGHFPHGKTGLTLKGNLP